jgi:hypothetical protein
MEHKDSALHLKEFPTHREPDETNAPTRTQ